MLATSAAMLFFFTAFVNGPLVNRGRSGSADAIFCWIARGVLEASVAVPIHLACRNGLPGACRCEYIDALSNIGIATEGEFW